MKTYSSEYLLTLLDIVIYILDIERSWKTLVSRNIQLSSHRLSRFPIKNYVEAVTQGKFILKLHNRD